NQPEQPAYLRDRGTGVATSMFGTYVNKGELLFYPFFEWYYDHNFEYKPNEFGHVGDVDYRGRYTASEGLIFLAYGITQDLAIEVEAAVISAELRKSSKDPSAMPSVLKESGLGDVEGQIRWRFRRETERRAEMFTYFESVLPLQKNKSLIGTPAWEHKLGFGITRGRSNGTWSFRTGIEWDGEDQKFEVGEYAFEYLRRLSPTWRIFSMIEGNQIDEIELVNEVQWHFHPRAHLKLGTGLGLTPNATDIAPEVGIMFRF
ncbi:MAG: hypothetical protein ACRD2A_25845, partial [Vicinamibacterales bacterium]